MYIEILSHFHLSPDIRCVGLEAFGSHLGLRLQFGAQFRLHGDMIVDVGVWPTGGIPLFLKCS